MKINDIKPIMYSLEKTERQMTSSGYTYNDVRLTYNSLWIINHYRRIYVN
jgi:hypothetical protein